MNRISLVSGGFYDFGRPEISEFTINDIARNLSNLCRYTGSLEKFYSVAQHSFLVSMQLEKIGLVHLAMEGLMHDASEAFLGDVASPLKQMLPDYKKIEYKVEKAIFDKYELPFPMDKQTKNADTAVFVAERAQLQPRCPQDFGDVTPADFKIVPWASGKAEKVFLERFYELGGVFK